jgi:hypothetical protein
MGTEQRVNLQNRIEPPTINEPSIDLEALCKRVPLILNPPKDLGDSLLTAGIARAIECSQAVGQLRKILQERLDAGLGTESFIQMINTELQKNSSEFQLRFNFERSQQLYILTLFEADEIIDQDTWSSLV